jgi:hypothetical protein
MAQTAIILAHGGAGSPNAHSDGPDQACWAGAAHLEDREPDRALFSDVALWGVDPNDLGHCFPEFDAQSDACRFRMCTHGKEPECGVRAAVEDGRIPRSRYESYLKLRAEAVEVSAR